MPLPRDRLDALADATRALHAGRTTSLGRAEPTAPPIHVASAYSYPTTDELDGVFEDNATGYVYSRYGNPTVRAFETAIAAIEKADEAIAYASGMAAIHALIALSVRPGETIVASRDLYGATLTLLRTHIAALGIHVAFVDVLDLDAVRGALASKPRLVLAEAISNPLIRVADIASLARITHDAGALLAIDNTFASSVVIKPIRHDADYVVHSTTKFIGGHGDTTGGVIATSTALAGPLREQAKLLGAIASPFDAWLALRGLRTLQLRVREQSRNAAAIAAWLDSDPRVSNVHYPGLTPDWLSSQFESSARGALLAFDVHGVDRGHAFRFLDALEICISGTTLGDVHTLLLYPAMSSHRGLTADQRAEIGISDGLLRLSAGIEAVEDIIADLDQALGAALH